MYKPTPSAVAEDPKIQLRHKEQAYFQAASGDNVGNYKEIPGVMKVRVN